MRSRLKKLIKLGLCYPGASISSKSLGCTSDQLKQHIESKFQVGMSWSNHGLHGWHIDHIRPLSSFDLLDPQQKAQASHFTNLQPLWAKDNMKKHAKYVNPIQTV